MRHAIPVAVAAVLVASAPAPTLAQESEEAETAEASTHSETRLAQADEAAGSDEAESDGDEGDDGAAGEASSEGQLQRSDRMEFDARLIRGERASGAVFLFQRTPRKLPSMVERRRTYLEGSIRTTLGDDWAETFQEERERSRASRSGDDESKQQPEGDLIDRMADDYQSDE